MAAISRCSFIRFEPIVSSPWRNKKLTPNPSRVGVYRVAARFEHEESDPLLRAALTAAWIRDQESRRSDPLFIDTYACGLLSTDTNSGDIDKSFHSTNASDLYRYRLATKFIDERLHQLLSSSDQFRQIVLLSDGMDTRPYRLNWPRLSLIYDLSPERVFELGTKRLKEIGTKTSRNCLLFHFPIESRNLQETLCKDGFNGNRPSLWVLQGTKEEWLEKVFLRHGFGCSIVKYSEVGGSSVFDSDASFETPDNVLFVAEQLRMSDAQMEVWRMHLARMDEEADEEGFEEL